MANAILTSFRCLLSGEPIPATKTSLSKGVPRFRVLFEDLQEDPLYSIAVYQVVQRELQEKRARKYEVTSYQPVTEMAPKTPFCFSSKRWVLMTLNVSGDLVDVWVNRSSFQKRIGIDPLKPPKEVYDRVKELIVKQFHTKLCAEFLAADAKVLMQMTKVGYSVFLQKKKGEQSEAFSWIRSVIESWIDLAVPREQVFSDKWFKVLFEMHVKYDAQFSREVLKCLPSFYLYKQDFPSSIYGMLLKIWENTVQGKLQEMESTSASISRYRVRHVVCQVLAAIYDVSKVAEKEMTFFAERVLPWAVHAYRNGMNLTSMSCILMHCAQNSGMSSIPIENIAECCRVLSFVGYASSYEQLSSLVGFYFSYVKQKGRPLETLEWARDIVCHYPQTTELALKVFFREHFERIDSYSQDRRALLSRVLFYFSLNRAETETLSAEEVTEEVLSHLRVVSQFKVEEWIELVVLLLTTERRLGIVYEGSLFRSCVETLDSGRVLVHLKEMKVEGLFTRLASSVREVYDVKAKEKLYSVILSCMRPEEKMVLDVLKRVYTALKGVDGVWGPLEEPYYYEVSGTRVGSVFLVKGQMKSLASVLPNLSDEDKHRVATHLFLTLIQAHQRGVFHQHLDAYNVHIDSSGIPYIGGWERAVFSSEGEEQDIKALGRILRDLFIGGEIDIHRYYPPRSMENLILEMFLTGVIGGPKLPDLYDKYTKTEKERIIIDL